MSIDAYIYLKIHIFNLFVSYFSVVVCVCGPRRLCACVCLCSSPHWFSMGAV